MTDLLSSRSLSCPNPICFNNLMYQRHPKAAKEETAQILQIIFESGQSENQRKFFVLARRKDVSATAPR